MTEQPTPETINQMQHWFAIETNNGAWDLMSKENRNPQENLQMLYQAYTSAYHWTHAGTALNEARAWMTIAHAHALLGQGEMALTYAQKCLDYFETNPATAWDLAFAHLEMAHAAAALQDLPLHHKHYEHAKEFGKAIQEEEDRKIFLDELRRIPDLNQ